MKHFTPILVACVLLFWNSCKQVIPEKKELLAKVGEVELYLEDIPQERLKPIFDEDSTMRIRRYVDKWTEEQFFLQQAKEVVAEDAQFLNEIIEEYKRNLMIYELEKHWIENYKDTLVSEKEVEDYYEMNKDNFQLRKNIVKIKYIKVHKDLAAKELGRVRQWLQSGSAVADSLLRVFTEQSPYADNYFLDSNWLYFDDVLREIPISSDYNQERYLRNNRFVQLEEGDFLYMVNFIDFKIKDSTTPLEFEAENISKYIVIQRRTKYLEDKRKELFRNAVNTGKIKVWVN